MEYTKGESIGILSQGQIAHIKEKGFSPIICLECREIETVLVGLEANAHLIVSCVNACIKLNPDNPQAVAEGVGDLYEALENANRVLGFIRDKGGFAGESIGKLECNRAIEVSHKALAKVKPRGSWERDSFLPKLK